MSNCQFYYSYAYEGAALCFNVADGAVSNCLFKGNNVYYSGAGIMVNYGNVRISGNSFLNNTGNIYWESRGVGIYCTNSTCIIDGNYFAANTSFWGAAGISAIACNYKILNNLLVNNTLTYGGSALTLQQSWNTGNVVANNTICNNTGGTGAVSIEGYADVINNIIWGNSGSQGQITARTNGWNQFYDYNCIEGGLGSIYIENLGSPGWQVNQYGDHNVTINPAFNIVDGNWNITASSSCYNTGDPATDISSYPLDILGNNRIAENRIDIGAYEFMSPTIPQTPQNLSMILSSANQALLSWTPVNQAMDGSLLTINHYQVYSAQSPEGPWTPLGQAFSAQFLLNISDVSKRFYRVSAQSN